MTKKKSCCEWHNNLPESWSGDVTPDDGYMECGLAGMGTPTVCCKNCPEVDWFVNKRGIPIERLHLFKNIMALPEQDRP